MEFNLAYQEFLNASSANFNQGMIDSLRKAAGHLHVVMVPGQPMLTPAEVSGRLATYSNMRSSAPSIVAEPDAQHVRF